jgi:hypothetical protein
MPGVRQIRAANEECRSYFRTTSDPTTRRQALTSPFSATSDTQKIGPWNGIATMAAWNAKYLRLIPRSSGMCKCLKYRQQHFRGFFGVADGAARRNPAGEAAGGVVNHDGDGGREDHHCGVGGGELWVGREAQGGVESFGCRKVGDRKIDEDHRVSDVFGSFAGHVD